MCQVNFINIAQSVQYMTPSVICIRKNKKHLTWKKTEETFGRFPFQNRQILNRFQYGKSG